MIILSKIGVSDHYIFGVFSIIFTAFASVLFVKIEKKLDEVLGL
jgi:hypothetical protein